MKNAFAVMASLFVAVAVCGCTTGADGIYIDETIWIYATNRIDRAVERHSPAPDAATGDGPVQEVPGGSVGAPSDGGATSGAGDSSSLKLDFRYGGFNGSRAVEDANCQIGSLKLSRDGLSFRWVKGGCEMLGAADREDYDHTVACVFFWDGSKWVGGKFDWVSTSRTYRDFENVHGGYGGWNADAFFGAKKHGFVIVSADGKKRSNFIED